MKFQCIFLLIKSIFCTKRNHKESKEEIVHCKKLKVTENNTYHEENLACVAVSNEHNTLDTGTNLVNTDENSLFQTCEGNPYSHGHQDTFSMDQINSLIDLTTNKKLDVTDTDKFASNTEIQSSSSVLVPQNEAYLQQEYHESKIFADLSDPNKIYYCQSSIVPITTQDQTKNFQINQIKNKESDKKDNMIDSTSLIAQKYPSIRIKKEIKKEVEYNKEDCYKTPANINEQDSSFLLGQADSFVECPNKSLFENYIKNEILEISDFFYDDRICIVKLDSTKQKMLEYSKNPDIDSKILSKLEKSSQDKDIESSGQPLEILSNDDYNPKCSSLLILESFPQNLISSVFDIFLQKSEKNEESQEKIDLIQQIKYYNENTSTSEEEYFNGKEINVVIKSFGNIAINKIISNLENDFFIRFIELFSLLTNQDKKELNFFNLSNEESLSYTMYNLETFFNSFIFGYSYNVTNTYVANIKRKIKLDSIKSQFNYPWDYMIYEFNSFYGDYLHNIKALLNFDHEGYFNKLDDLFFTQSHKNLVVFFIYFLKNKNNSILLDLYPELIFFFEYLHEGEQSLQIFKTLHSLFSLLSFKLNFMKQFLKKEFLLKKDDDNFILSDSKNFNHLDLEISFFISCIGTNILTKKSHKTHLIYKTFLKFLKIKYPEVFQCFLENEFCYGIRSIDVTSSIKIATSEMHYLKNEIWKLENLRGIYKIDKIKKWIKLRISCENTNEITDLSEINLFILKDLTKKMCDFLMTA